MKADKLIAEITKWSKVYEFSFQFWGPDNNNVYINKGGVELVHFGGERTIEDIIDRALEWVNRQNPSGFKEPDPSINHCEGCGARIAVGNDFCGECLCEDDSDY